MNKLTDPAKTLRRALVLDAFATGAMGLGLVAAAGRLSPLVGISEPLLRGAGIVLLPFTAALIYLYNQPRLSRRAAWVIVAANALWAVDSVLVLAARWIDPNALGVAFVLVQAAAVAALAWLEYRGLRLMRAAA